jgi:hypothetical protein
MKILFLIFSTIVCQVLFAQDFLYFKSGTVEEVKIFFLDAEKGILGYERNGVKTFRAITSLEKYELNTLIVFDSTANQLVAGRHEISGAKNFDSDKGIYDFDKWSISTDLAALFSPDRNSIITLEPEFQLNHNWSIRFPLRIGLQNYYFAPGSYNAVGDYWGQYEPNMPPREPYFDNYLYLRDQLVFEIGATPKFYPYGKSKRLFSPYLGGTLKAGYWKGQAFDEYITVDTATNDIYTNWYITDLTNVTNPYDIPFVNTELLIGFELVFSRVLNVSFEAALDMNMYYGNIIPNNYHTSYFGSDFYSKSIIPDFYVDRTKGRFRVFLTYRLGGQKIAD